MIRFRKISTCMIGLSLLIAPASISAADKAPDTWDGLYKVKAKKMELVYLQPQADFRSYTKVLLDPAEVAFRKNWQRDQNDDRLDLANRVSDSDARRILDAARDGLAKVFTKAYQNAGYQVVTAPGPDVLRISTAVVNLDVAAPDVMTAGRSRSYSREAGSATLAVEARDSVSGSLLGRAVDSRDTGDAGLFIRNSVTNSSEFEQLFASWAKISAQGLNELKELSPIDTNGQMVKK